MNKAVVLIDGENFLHKVDQILEADILCSSDSDLQPAVKEARNRGMNIVYLGFSIDPNKGLMMTTNQTILFRNPEIIDAVKI
jgi:hypothetical protein